MKVIDISAPPTGEALDRARLVAWHVVPGQAFKAGDLLVEIETDKSVVEIPAPHGGVLLTHWVDVGGEVNADTLIARVQVDEETSAAMPAAISGPNVSGPEPMPAPVQVSAPPQGADSRHVPRPFSTPAARRLARERGVAVHTLTGSGPDGRVTVADIERAQVHTPPGAPQPESSLESQLDDWVDTRHGPVHVARRGRADSDHTVVLIHGLFGDSDTWAGLAHALVRSGVRVLAPDLPCHGATRIDVAAFEDMVDVVADVIAARCAGGVTLAGHSFGAALAARVARRPGVPVQALILIAPLGLGTEINHSFLHGMCHAASDEAVARDLGKLTAQGAVPSARVVQTLRQGLHTRREALIALCAQIAVDGAQQIHIVSDLSQTPYRCTVIHGRHDAIIPWRHALAAPPETALHLPADAGHMPQWEASQLVCNLVLAARPV